MPAGCAAKCTEDMQNALKKSKLGERETHLREKKEEKADSSGRNRPRNDMSDPSGANGLSLNANGVFARGEMIEIGELFALE